MAGQWLTRLYQLFDMNVNGDDILLVKLVTITYGKNDTQCRSETKICPAHMVNNGNYVTWYVNDTIDDFLCIDAPIDATANLGHTVTEPDDKAYPDDLTVIHVIAACKVVRFDKINNKFTINQDIENLQLSKFLASAETFREAKNILAALEASNITAKINKV